MTGEEREQLRSAAMELGSRGGKARAANMSPRRRRELARHAAESRWRKRDRGADACVLTWCGGGTYLHGRAAHAVLYGSDQIVMTTYGCDLPFFPGAAAATAVSVFHDLRVADFVLKPVTDALPHY